MGGFLSRFVRKALNYIDPRGAFSDSVTAFFGGQPSVRLNFREYNARQSSIVMACLNWVSRNIVEAPIQIQERKDAGSFEPMEESEILTLLARPNPHYDWDDLLKATASDLNVSGSGYWWKIKNPIGGVMQLWWLPSTTVEPMWDKTRRTMGPVEGAQGDNWITHYKYRPDGIFSQGVRIETEDVVQLRMGMDPDNPRLGYSPLKALAREFYTDEEASSWTASFLKNGAIPSAVISPPPGKDYSELQANDLEELKKFFQERLGGANRGSVVVARDPVQVNTVSWSPEQMNLKGLRRIPEERISAALGVPAIVAGLGAGLDRSTFANFQEARRHAYESEHHPHAAAHWEGN